MSGRECRAFTLVELLVVIGVIAVLIAILLPALGRARYQAQVTTCLARLHDFSAGMMLYAADNRGYFPRDDVATQTGRNLCDVSNHFYHVLSVRHRRPYQTFFCPMAMDEQMDPQWAFYYRPEPDSPNGFSRIGYAVWIPRAIGGSIIPPSTTAGGLSLYDSTESIRGPIRVGEKIAVANPILSDLVLTLNVRAYPGPNDPSRDKTLAIFRNSTHVRGGVLESTHLAFADGHVESARAAQVKPRYLGRPANYWNWR